MKTHRSILRSTILPLSAIALLTLNSQGQTENPVQGGHSSVTGGPPTGSVRAEIVPLFWKASIGRSIVSVPLRSVEYFGVQTYDVDAVARVRELTIATQSRGMIRIYHMVPLSAIAERAENTLSTLGRIAEDAADEDLNVPVKVFPSTTHKYMVEYRVSKREHIDKLYKHLETTMKDYHARVLVPGQRNDTIREVKVGGEE